jgi:hypothetical protein
VAAQQCIHFPVAMVEERDVQVILLSQKITYLIGKLIK